jgi:hypothetical protein
VGEECEQVLVVVPKDEEILRKIFKSLTGRKKRRLPGF